MDKSRIKRNHLLVILTIFRFVFALQIADPVAAATAPASGHVWIQGHHGYIHKYAWKVTKLTSTVSKIQSSYFTETNQRTYGSTIFETTYIYKTGKNKGKVMTYRDGYYFGSSSYKSSKTAYGYAKQYVADMIVEYKKYG
jgi:hypothetical protein